MSTPAIDAPRPWVKITPYKWRDAAGDETPGIAFRRGSHLVLHVTPEEAFELANTLTDMAERIEAGELPTRTPRPPEPADARQATAPAYTSHSPPLTAANGDPEQPLPATTADNE